MEHRFRHGVSYGDLACLTGKSVSALRRRLRGLVQRLGDPRVRHLLHERHRLSAQTREVAWSTLIAGRTLRATSVHLGLSLHEVRAQVRAFNAAYHVAPKRRLALAG